MRYRVPILGTNDINGTMIQVKIQIPAVLTFKNPIFLRFWNFMQNYCVWVVSHIIIWRIEINFFEIMLISKQDSSEKLRMV